MSHTSLYATVLYGALHDGRYSEMIHLFAVSAAFDVVIQSYIPPSPSVGPLDSPFTCVVVGRAVRPAAPYFTLMWTSTQSSRRKPRRIAVAPTRDVLFCCTSGVHTNFTIFAFFKRTRLARKIFFTLLICSHNHVSTQ